MIDLSADFLDAAEANATAFSVEAIAGYLRALAPGGIVSIPVSIRDFPVYALRMLATARAALLAPASPIRRRMSWCIARPGARASCCRASPGTRRASRRCGNSATTARSTCRGIPASTSPPRAPASTTTCRRCPSPAARCTSRRSGRFHRRRGRRGAGGRRQPIARRRSTWRRSRWTGRSSMPCCGWTSSARILQPAGDPAAGGDRRAGQPGGAGAGGGDRRAGAAGAAGRAAPAARPARRRCCAPIVYFPALGLGFLFIEIFLIEQASFWLNDRTTGFALVLTGMLVFSGLGSMVADRLGGGATARRSRWPCLVVVAGALRCWLGLQPADAGDARPALAGARRPGAGGAGTGVAGARPAVPARAWRASAIGGVLPWAWGLNGAFSVVATPLANLIAREAGFSRVLLCAALLYVVALVTFPRSKEEQRVAGSVGTITRRGVISAAGALSLAAPGARRDRLDARRLPRRR